jgi:hypothetical protein
MAIRVCVQIILILISAPFFNSANAAGPISDSLVFNLSCDRLSIEAIYDSIKPEAFATNRHIPIHNWSFANGPYNLGVCWSLSHAQRLLFYLAQWQDHNPSEDDYTATYGIPLLNLFRGSKPVKGSFANVRDLQLKEFYTFQIQSFSTDSGLFADILKGIWDPLQNYLPLDHTFNEISGEDLSPLVIANGKLLRKFTTEIERYQRWRFHQFQNSKLTTEPVPRPRNVNLQLSNALIANLDRKRMPLVDIKPTLTTQHIVAIKNYERGPELIKFFVYDSNLPNIDNYFIYDVKKQQFKAHEIIKNFSGIRNPDQDVSVYLVDEEDQQKIDQALFNFYKGKCQ